jgi:hypothetical protein
MDREDPLVGDGARRGSPATKGYDGRARQDEAPDEMPAAPPCTFCEGSETEMMNAFGSQLSVATYWCRDCRCPFEFMKWRR